MEYTDRTVRIALIDMYEGVENQGMRCLTEIINQWADYNNYNHTLDIFEVRIKQEIPDFSYDFYISTGGPGSPIDSKGKEWENKFFNFINKLEHWNAHYDNYPKKHILFICHSFQLACRYFNVAEVNARKSTSFGVFPIHMIDGAESEQIFKGLTNPFYVVDSRDYQVVKPKHKLIKEMGGAILAIEKERTHVPLERAVMAIRFNEYCIGTQFHPEADAQGMSMYLQRADKKETVIKNHGEAKWESMLEQLGDPNKILFTYNHIVPNFLNHAMGTLIVAGDI